MKILLIGANGQLGWELLRTCPAEADLTAVDCPEIDITRPESITACLGASTWDWVLNAAAYTGVDKAETEAAMADQINHQGVRHLAAACRETAARLVHISTDFVFNGRGHRPYPPDHPPDPQSVYGRTKYEGELAVQQILGAETLIIRTAWLYSAHGGNFVKTMLNLMQEKEQLTVVDDQIGTPTWARGLAEAVWASLAADLKGVFHWTDAGVASWYDFALAIQEEALALGLLSRQIPIIPVNTEAYRTPASRPAYSVLDKQATWRATGLTPVHWRRQLRFMLQELREGSNTECRQWT